METGREKKEEGQQQIKVEKEIIIVGVTYTLEPTGPKGGLRKVKHETKKVVKVVISGVFVEFFYENKSINRFEFKGKLKNTQINNIAAVLKDIGAFDKTTDARQWIVAEGLFDKLSKLKEELDQKRKDNYDTNLTRKYELKVVKPDVSKDVSKQVMTLLLQDKQDEATEVIVAKIEKDEVIKTLRDDNCEELWMYQRDGKYEGIYIPNGKSYIQEKCRNILGDAYSTRIYKNVIEKIKADTFIEAKEFFEDQHIDLVCVNNGVLNIRTKELLPFGPEYKFFSKHPVNFINGQDCPSIKQFFKSLFKDALEISVIQELFGFLLYRDYFLEKAFMFLGSGRNGKGKTILLMKAFVGAENTSQIPLEDLEKDLFSLGEMFKKNANLAGDLSRGALRRSGKFKSLTGRDPIQAARKYLSRLPFVSYAKQIFACNELPFTHDLTDAFFDRWIILNFPFRFLPQKEIQEDPINQNENTKVQDPNIIDKISTDSEMSGLLNWALEGLERLFTNKAFSFSPSTSETRNTWLRKSDSCLAFVMDYIESDYENYIIKSDFKAKYAAYCKLHKVDISDDKQILQVLTTHAGASDDRKSIDIEGSTKQRAVWNGIRFKDCIENLFTTNMGQNSKPSEGRDGISITSNTQGKDTSRNTLSRFTTLSNCDEEKNELNSEKIEEEDF